jgi:hypothetical protein
MPVKPDSSEDSLTIVSDLQDITEIRGFGLIAPRRAAVQTDGRRVNLPQNFNLQVIEIIFVCGPYIIV